MLTQSLSTSVVGNKISPVTYPAPAPDQFGAVTGHAGLIATEFSYKKDEEIYGEDELAEYIYQVIGGAVRSYKLLSDGRRQIGAFHLPGDVFGLGQRFRGSNHIPELARSENRRGKCPFAGNRVTSSDMIGFMESLV
jgi:hypothetical protein